MPWRQTGDWLINILIAPTVPPPPPRLGRRPATRSAGGLAGAGGRRGGWRGVGLRVAGEAGGSGARHAVLQRGGKQPDEEEGRPRADCARISTERSPAGAGRGSPPLRWQCVAARVWSTCVRGLGRCARGNEHSSTAGRGGRRSAGHGRHDFRGRAQPGRRASSRISGGASTWSYVCHRRSRKDQWRSNPSNSGLAHVGTDHKAGQRWGAWQRVLPARRNPVFTAVWRVGDLPLVTERQTEAKVALNAGQSLAQSGHMKCRMTFVQTPSFHVSAS